MKSASPFVAATAAVLAHAALIVLVVTALSHSQKQTVPPPPLTIRLLPEQAPAPVAPLPAAPAPATQPPGKKRRVPKPRPKDKAVVQPRQAPTPQVQAPAPSVETEPAVSDTTAARPAATAAPAAPTAPKKTSVSVATYAADNRKPTYPRLSRINDEQGTVMLRVLAKADGTAGMVEIKASSGYPLLDESARRAVQVWRFNPATIDGKPIAEWYQLAVPFTLQVN